MPKTQNSTKLCPRCGREFAWRKRWRENWEQVVYCSQRCRRTPLEDLDRAAPGQELRVGLHAIDEGEHGFGGVVHDDLARDGGHDSAFYDPRPVECDSRGRKTAVLAPDPP